MGLKVLVADQKRFATKVARGGGCWEWTGATTALSGHGRFRLDGRTSGAHCVAWLMHHAAPIPDQMHVLHNCDNPPCVRPDHLRLGTHADNMSDMKERGRAHKGETHFFAKLTDEAVAEIRERYERNYTTTDRGWGIRSNARELAAEFGTCETNISMIARGKSRAS